MIITNQYDNIKKNKAKIFQNFVKKLTNTKKQNCFKNKLKFLVI